MNDSYMFRYDHINSLDIYFTTTGLYKYYISPISGSFISRCDHIPVHMLPFRFVYVRINYISYISDSYMSRCDPVPEQKWHIFVRFGLYGWVFLSKLKYAGNDKIWNALLMHWVRFIAKLLKWMQSTLCCKVVEIVSVYSCATNA